MNIFHDISRIESTDQASKMVGFPGHPDGPFISFSALWAAVQDAENTPVPPGAVVVIDTKEGYNRVKIVWT